MGAINASSAYLDRLERFERNQAITPGYGPYDDNGVTAWGFGSRNPSIDIVDYASARKQLEIDVQEKIKLISPLISANRKPFTQGQQDSIIDIMYNLRMPEHRMKDFARVLNGEDDRETTAWISQFTKAESGKDLKARLKQESIMRRRGTLAKGESLPRKMTEEAGLVRRKDWRVKSWGSDMPAAEEQESIGVGSVENTVEEIEADSNLSDDRIEEANEVAKAEPISDAQSDILSDLPDDLDDDVEKEQPEIEDDDSGPQINEIAHEEGEDILSDLPDDLRGPQVSNGIPADDGEEDDEFDNSTAQLTGVRDSTKNIFVDDIRNAKKYKQRYEVPLDQGMILSQSKQFNLFDKNEDLRDTAIKYPAIAKFATKPENFAILGDDFQDLRRIEVGAVAMSDTEIVARGGLSDIMKGYKHLQIGLGLKSAELGSSEIDEIQDIQDTLPMMKNRRAVDKLMRETSEMQFQFRQFSDAVDSFNPDDVFDILPEIGRLMSEAGYAASEVYDLAKAMTEDKEGTTLFILQSTLNGVVPILGQAVGATVGAGIGFFTPVPFGAKALAVSGGTIGAGVMGALNSYMIRMNELMDKTGYGGNAAGFYSDPERVAAANKIARKYGAYMGLIDAALARFTGTFTGRNIGKARAAKEAGKAFSKGKLVTSTASSLSKDFVLRFGTEGPQEFFSRATPGLIPLDIAGAGAPGDPIHEAAGEATVEQLVGGPVAVAATGVGATIQSMVGAPRFFKEMPVKRKFKKMAKLVDTATKAATSRMQFSELQKAWNDSPKAQEFPDQVGEIVEEGSSRKSDTDEEIENITGDEDTTQEDGKKRPDDDDSFIAEAAKQQKIIEDREALKQSTVRIRPDEFEALLDARGITPEAALESLGEGVLAAYMKARNEGADLEISVADFVIIGAEDNELADIVRFGDNEQNAKDAQVVHDESEQMFIKLFMEGNDDSETKADETPDGKKPKEGKEKKQAEEGKEPTESAPFSFGDQTIGMLELTTRHRSRADKLVIKEIRTGLAKTAKKNKNITKRMLDIMTDIQYRHLQWRSIVTGRNITEMSKAMRFAQGTKEQMGNTLGVVEYATTANILLKLQEDVNVNTLIHELAHTWMYDAMFDWDHMFSIEEENLTHEQGIYKTALEDLAKELGLETLNELRFLDVQEIPNPDFDPDVKGSERTIDRNPVEAEIFNLAQESFAQTAEKYFLDGKFKNSRIRGIMELMRSWLQPIAKYVGEAYRHKWPAKDITPAFESIFEGILGVSEKVDEAMFPLFPDPMFDAEDLLTKDAKRYREEFAKARAQAFNQIVADSVNQSMRERQRIIDKAVKEITKEAKEEVNKRQSMVIAKIFKARKAPDKISRKSFMDAFKDAELLKTLPKGIVGGTKKSGLNLMDAIFNEGIESPAEFLRLMQEANRFDELVLEESNKMIEENFPVTKTDEEIKQIAIDTLTQKGGVEKVYALEMKILAEKFLLTLKSAGKALILPAELKKRMEIPELQKEAERIINDSFMLKFKPSNFLNASRKNAVQAARFFRIEADIEGALEAKQLQIQNAMAYQFAKSAEAQINKFKSLFKFIGKMNRSKFKDEYNFEGIKFARDLIEAYERQVPMPAISRDLFPKGTETTYTDEWIADVQRRVDELSGPEGKLIGQVLRAGEQTTKIQTFIELGNLVNMVKVAAANAMVVEIDGKNITIAEAEETLALEIGLRRESDPRVEPKLTEDRAFRKFSDSKLRMRETITGLFPNNIEAASSIMMKLYNQVAQGEANFVRELEEAGDLISGLLRIRKKQKNGSVWEAWTQPALKKAPLVLGTIAKVARFSPNQKLKEAALAAEKAIIGNEPVFWENDGGESVTFDSREHIIVAILLSGSESGTAKFLLGGIGESGALATVDKKTGKLDTAHWEAFIQKMIDEKVLIKEDFDFMQGVWDVFDRHHEGANAAHRKVMGMPFGKIEAKEFTNEFGTYSGGYFPTKQDGVYSELKVFDSFTNDPYASTANMLYGQSNLNFTKERKQVYKPLDLTLKSIPQVLHFTLQLKHMFVPMNDFAKVFNQPVVRTFLEARRPGVFNKVITPWFDRTKNQQYSSRLKRDQDLLHGLNSVSRILRQHARREWFFGKYKSAVKQYLGIVQSASKVDPKYLIEGIAASKNFGETMKTIRNLSNRMDVRFNANQKRMLNSYENIDMSGDWVGQAQENIDKGTFFLIQAAQNHTDMVVWVGAFKMGSDRGLSGQTLVDFADNTVEQTQGTSMISARSELQQQMEFIRIFTDFTTVPMAMFHQNLETYLQNKDEDIKVRIRRQLAVAISTMALPTTMIAVTGAAMTALLGGEHDEDEDDFTDRLMKDIALEAIDVGSPLIGRNLVGLASQFTNKPLSLRPSPAFDMLGSAVKANRARRDIFNGVPTDPKEFANIFTAFTIYTGIPTPLIDDIIRFPLRSETREERAEREQVRAIEKREARLREQEEDEE